MPKSNVDDYRVICPFYKYDRDRQLHCEAPEGVDSLRLYFSKPANWCEYKLNYCSDINGHKKCSIYKMNMEKYK